MIVERDGSLYAEWDVTNSDSRISMPLEMAVLAIKETRTLEEQRLRLFEIYYEIRDNTARVARTVRKGAGA